MKDTTTTLHDELKDILVEYADPGGDVFCGDKYLINDLVQWHQDKARSYVPERKNKTFQGTRDLDSVQYAHLSGMWDGYNEAIDQTLKAIGGQDNE